MVDRQKKMEKDFLENADTVLASFIKKQVNRVNTAKVLWKRAEGNPDYANYLLYEVFAEYLVSPKLEEVLGSIKSKTIGFSHPVFEEYKIQRMEYDTFLMNPPELEEGVIECTRCGSRKTFSFSKQTRRADESATVFVRCAQCGKSFRM